MKPSLTALPARDREPLSGRSSPTRVGRLISACTAIRLDGGLLAAGCFGQASFQLLSLAR